MHILTLLVYRARNFTTINYRNDKSRLDIRSKQLFRTPVGWSGEKNAPRCSKAVIVHSFECGARTLPFGVSSACAQPKIMPTIEGRDLQVRMTCGTFVTTCDERKKRLRDLQLPVSVAS